MIEPGQVYYTQDVAVLTLERVDLRPYSGEAWLCLVLDCQAYPEPGVVTWFDLSYADWQQVA